MEKQKQKRKPYRKQRPQTAEDFHKLYGGDSPVEYKSFTQTELQKLASVCKLGGYIGILFLMPEGYRRVLTIFLRGGIYRFKSSKGWDTFNRAEAGESDVPGTDEEDAEGDDSANANADCTPDENYVQKLNEFRAVQEQELAMLHLSQSKAFTEFLNNIEKERVQKRTAQAEAERKRAEADRKHAEEARAKAEAPRHVSPRPNRLWWDVLKVQSNAPYQEVRRAWKTAQFRTHPDRGGTHEDFVEVGRAWREAQAAYRVAYHQKQQHQQH